MKKEENRKAMQRAISSLQLNEKFNTTGLKFEMRTYEKGTLIISPDKPLRSFLFIIIGKIQIYQLTEQGHIQAINIASEEDILGNIEFCMENQNLMFYAEAIETTQCIELNFEQYGEMLRDNSSFLMYLLKHTVKSNMQHSALEKTTSNIEDKVLFYIENMCPNKTLENVNNATTVLQCSRRQLQRILKKLCDADILIREKKGCYVLKAEKGL